MRFTSLLCSFLLAAAPSAAVSDTQSNYTTLQTTKNGDILTVTLNNTITPVNLYSQIMGFELDHLVTSLQTDTLTKVVIFRSANPKFFIAHFDVIPRPGDTLPVSSLDLSPLMGQIIFNITELPQTTIGIIEGPTRGIGNEFTMSLDMRFATSEAVFGNFEVTVGLHPGAGGVVYMSELIGRGRALEYLLSGNDIDAESAENFGLVNRLFDSSAQLNTFVSQLSKRIALFPLDALASIKGSVNAVTRAPREQFLAEAEAWNKLLAKPTTQESVAKFVNLTKNETDIAVELNLAEEVLQLYED
ncbi:3-hydroxypropionyl-coenzyme A dehydratase [Cladobotryum mycophilum]|uniref:3-hydroxypropionyl-coenzyme A dehydratase n=1 Tax=Cladobotryum mycophilum TaxID=491253 RepID=A0ABR0SJR7_9HYPO